MILLGFDTLTQPTGDRIESYTTGGQILSGKHISDDFCLANIQELSLEGAKLILNSDEQKKLPSPLTNIKINLNIPDHEFNEDIYAKVIENQSSTNLFRIVFTSLPTNIANYFEQLLNQTA